MFLGSTQKSSAFFLHHRDTLFSMFGMLVGMLGPIILEDLGKVFFGVWPLRVRRK